MDTFSRKHLMGRGKEMHGVSFEFWECKCGHTEEISVHVDIEWHVCQKCKRRGVWFRAKEEVKDDK